MMKNYLLLMMFAGFLLSSCQPVKVEVKTGSLKTQGDHWEMNVENSVFSSRDRQTEESCMVLNNKVRQLIDSLQSELKAQTDTFFTTYEGEIGGEYKYQLVVEDSVFMASAQYISLRMLVYTFMGGAHGMTDFYGFDYDVRNQKFLTPEEVLDFGKTAEIDTLLGKHFKDENGCFSTKPTLKDGFVALNFTPEAVCFTYPHYSLGAYACGYVQVSIPRDELKGIIRIK